MKKPRSTRLLYIVGLCGIVAGISAALLDTGVAAEPANAAMTDPAAVRIVELSSADLFRPLTPETIIILTSVEEFRARMRLAVGL